jgi:hypothetical protein
MVLRGFFKVLSTNNLFAAGTSSGLLITPDFHFFSTFRAFKRLRKPLFHGVISGTMRVDNLAHLSLLSL